MMGQDDFMEFMGYRNMVVEDKIEECPDAARRGETEISIDRGDLTDDEVEYVKKEVEKAERAERAVSDAKKALSDSEKELRSADEDKALLDAEMKKADAELQTIQAGVDGEKMSAASDYSNSCNENDAQVSKLQNELQSLEAQKSEAEAALSKTFFLVFGKKKELNARIASLSTQISDKKSEIENTQKKKQDYLNTRDNRLKSIDDKVSAAEKKVQELSAKLKTAVQRLEKANAGVATNREKLTKATQNYDVVIAKKKEKEEALEAEVMARKEKEKQAEEARKQQAKAEAERQETARKEAERKAAEEQAQRAATEQARRAEAEKQSARMSSGAASTIVRPSNMDSKLQRLYDRLEKWYPEHKAYAMDNVDKSLREELAVYAKSRGKSVEQELGSIGFELISGSDVYALRHPKQPKPGQEPAVFKDKINSILARLNEYYPDRKISRSIQNDHKALAGSISGAYQWLGYASTDEFLTAYGFDYSAGQFGRPTGDYDAVIEGLKAKYPNGPKFSKLGDLIADNSDIAGKINTMRNKSNELFGMSLAKYFQTIGLLTPMSAHQIAENERKSRVDNLIAFLHERYPKGSDYTSLEAVRKHNEDLEGWDDVTDRILVNRGIIKKPKFINICKVSLANNGGEVICELKRKYRNLRKANTFAILADDNGTHYYGSVISDATEIDYADLTCDASELYELINVDKGEVICRDIMESSPEDAGAAINAFTNALILSDDGKRVIRYEEGKNYLRDIVVLPDSVETIEDEVFLQAKFKELHIGKALKHIGAKTLVDEKGFTKENIINIVVSDDNSTFLRDENGFYEIQESGKKSLLIYFAAGGETDIFLADDIEKVEAGAFSRCHGIKNINIPDSVAHIGGDPNNFWAAAFHVNETNPNMFMDEDSLYEVIGDDTYKLVTCRYFGKGRPLIMKGTSIIGDYAFKAAEYLKSEGFYDGSYHFNYEFCDMKSKEYAAMDGFKTLSLPQSVTCIGEEAFSGTLINRLSIPKTVRRIEKHAFAYCPMLEDADMPAELEYVADDVFEGCKKLASVTEAGKKGVYSLPTWGRKILTYHGQRKSSAAEQKSGKQATNDTLRKIYEKLVIVIRNAKLNKVHENDSVYLDETNKAVVVKTCLEQRTNDPSIAATRVEMGEKLKVGDPLKIRLRSQFSIFWEFLTMDGKSVADDRAFIAEQLRHQLNNLDITAKVADVVPKSQRRKSTKYALVTAEITIKEKTKSAEQSDSDSDDIDFDYIIEDEKAYILNWKGHAGQKKLIFPAQIEGRPVAEIDKRVFETSLRENYPGKADVEIIGFEEGITTLREGNLAVDGFENLKYVVIPNSVTRIIDGEYFDVFGFDSNSNQLERLVIIVAPDSKVYSYFKNYKGYLDFPLTLASSMEEAQQKAKSVGMFTFEMDEDIGYTVGFSGSWALPKDFSAEIAEIPETVFGEKVVCFRKGDIPKSIKKIIIPRYVQKITGWRYVPESVEVVIAPENEWYTTNGKDIFKKDGTKL